MNALQFATHLKSELRRINFKRSINVVGPETPLLDLQRLLDPTWRRHINFILWYPPEAIEALARHSDARQKAAK